MHANKGAEIVLVVEDEILILLNTVDELERAGFTALEAVNANLALRALEQRRDITHLFSDIDLPGGIDGLQLAEVVGKSWPPVAVILTSGHRPQLFVASGGPAFL